MQVACKEYSCSNSCIHIDWNAFPMELSIVFANGLQISTKTIMGVKCSQRMCAIKHSKQIFSAVQAVQPSAPLFRIISYLGTFLIVQTPLLLSLYLLQPMVVFPSCDFTDLRKDM